ncbi:MULTISPECIES: SigB/SigF/SigG family RNA polymerase sigma factor [unclassified Streptomyces]|uniref:SigB/SigF/SigG family RNA polymerase sigma factor n=1 Tax=unclassified Streptomyces TaxID=2593676 RepID=UPI00364BC869
MVFTPTAVRAPAPGEDRTTTRRKITAAAARFPHRSAPDGAAALFTRLRELDDGPERETVRADLVTLWLPMAYRVAGRFHDRGEAMEDLRQVAALGLVKAMDRFDPARGAFESYAIPTITGELKRHFRDKTWALRVPRRVQELRNQVRVARRELTDLPGSHEPSIADLAVHTGLTEKDVADGMEAMESYTTLSLDAELASTGDGHRLGDILGAIDSSYDLVVDREAAKNELRLLPDRDRSILYMRFFEDMTQTRIAQELGVSQMHVCRLIARSCARVREEAMGQNRSTRRAAEAKDKGATKAK